MINYVTEESMAMMSTRLLNIKLLLSAFWFFTVISIVCMPSTFTDAFYSYAAFWKKNKTKNNNPKNNQKKPPTKLKWKNIFNKTTTM